MHRRITDNVIPPMKLTREIPTSWLITTIIAVLFWAGSQWVNYSKLVDTSITQSKSIADLTSQVYNMSERFNDTKLETVKQNFEVANIKQRLENLEGVVTRNAQKLSR